jgi:hypothetical protein
MVSINSTFRAQKAASSVLRSTFAAVCCIAIVRPELYFVTDPLLASHVVVLSRFAIQCIHQNTQVPYPCLSHSALAFLLLS